MERFNCLHCGHCCDDILVQVNLTFGDISRLGTALNKPTMRLFDEGIIDFNPFIDPETRAYDIELGLEKPCRLHRAQRCSVYEARPLNCRLFPFWVLAHFGPKGLRDECAGVSGIKDSSRLYLKYTKALGKILLRESQKTDKVVGRLKKELGFNLDGLMPGMLPTNKAKEAVRLRAVKAMISRIDTGLLRKGVARAISEGKWATPSELGALEQLMKPF